MNNKTKPSSPLAESSLFEGRDSASVPAQATSSLGASYGRLGSSVKGVSTPSYLNFKTHFTAHQFGPKTILAVHQSIVDALKIAEGQEWNAELLPDGKIVLAQVVRDDGSY